MFGLLIRLRLFYVRSYLKTDTQKLWLMVYTLLPLYDVVSRSHIFFQGTRDELLLEVSTVDSLHRCVLPVRKNLMNLYSYQTLYSFSFIVSNDKISPLLIRSVVSTRRLHLKHVLLNFYFMSGCSREVSSPGRSVLAILNKILLINFLPFYEFDSFSL